MSKNDIYFDDYSFEERQELLEIEEEPIDIPEDVEECTCELLIDTPCPIHNKELDEEV